MRIYFIKVYSLHVSIWYLLLKENWSLQLSILLILHELDLDMDYTSEMLLCIWMMHFINLRFWQISFHFCFLEAKLMGNDYWGYEL